MIKIFFRFVQLLSIFFLSVSSEIVPSVSAQTYTLTNDGIYNQLKNISWSYKTLIRPGDIPVPESMKQAIEPKVHSVYSPSVVKVSEGNYYMVFGVSLSCKAGNVQTIARDSIALAWSSNTDQWVFLKYILEPDPTTCFASLNQWVSGALFQINEPYAWLDGNTIRVMYTAAQYRPEKNGYGCGDIGMATFDKQFNLTFKNDHFLSGQSFCDARNTGLSRPSLRKIDAKTSEIWMDTNYFARKVPLTALDQMNSGVQVTREALKGGDIDTPDLDRSTVLWLYNGLLPSNGPAYNFPGITVQSKQAGDVVTAPWQLTQLSGEEWDSWFHGSPALYVEPGCKPVLYFAGMKKGPSNAPIGTIAKGTPPSNQSFVFPGCRS